VYVRCSPREVEGGREGGEDDVQVGTLLGVHDGGDGDTEVGDGAPEICGEVLLVMALCLCPKRRREIRRGGCAAVMTAIGLAPNSPMAQRLNAQICDITMPPSTRAQPSIAAGCILGDGIPNDWGLSDDRPAQLEVTEKETTNVSSRHSSRPGLTGSSH
jgi:hypothetical protein